MEFCGWEGLVFEFRFYFWVRFRVSFIGRILDSIIGFWIFVGRVFFRLVFILIFLNFWD